MREILKKVENASVSSGLPNIPSPPNAGRRKFPLLIIPSFLIILLTAFFLTQFLLGFSKNAENLCSIDSKNLCDGKVVEIKGAVNDSTFVQEYGYKFTPTGSRIKNEIYIGATRYDGLKIGQGPENFAVSPPFGRKITVRGVVRVSDAYRCTVKDYALANPQHCQNDTYRIDISPSSIITDKFDSEINYSIYGKLPNIKNDIKTCNSKTQFCEDNLGRAPGSCYLLNLTKDQCSQIRIDNDTFFISGITQSLHDPLSPQSLYQVNGIDFGNQSVNTVSGYDKFSLKPGVYSAYNKLGEKVATFNTGTVDFIDPDTFMPASEGIYFFLKDSLFLASKNGNIVKMGTLPSSYTGKGFTAYGFKMVDSGKSLVFMVSDTDSVRVVNQNSYTTNTFYLLKVALGSPSETLSPEVLYSEKMEGFINSFEVNPEASTVLISYSSAEESFASCQTTHYVNINLNDKSKTELFSLVTDGGGNIYCTEPMNRNMYSSGDGHYLIFGVDFNNNPATTQINRLVVYTISGNAAVKKEYLADSQLLRSQAVQITGVSDSEISLIDSSSDKIGYTFNLSRDKYSLDNLKPVISSPISLTPTPYPTDLYQIINSEYLYEDDKNWYFLSRDVNERKYYVVDKKTKKVFLASTFSLYARAKISANNNFYILDNDH